MWSPRLRRGRGRGGEADCASPLLGACGHLRTAAAAPRRPATTSLSPFRQDAEGVVRRATPPCPRPCSRLPPLPAPAPAHACRLSPPCRPSPACLPPGQGGAGAAPLQLLRDRRGGPAAAADNRCCRCCRCCRCRCCRCCRCCGWLQDGRRLHADLCAVRMCRGGARSQAASPARAGPSVTPPALRPSPRTPQVDSILVDEARTPLIISGTADKPSQKYYKARRVLGEP